MIDWDSIEKYLTYQEGSPLLFNTGLFLFWFIVLLIGYQAVVRNATTRVLFLLSFSFYFYYKASDLFLGLLLFTGLYDFLIGLALGKSKKEWIRRLLVTLSVLMGLGILGFFKYTNFFMEMYAEASGTRRIVYDIFLPIGISFYTFQTLSYTIDVYRRKLEPVKNLLDYYFYLSFFPHLVAGPIVKASHFLPQIRRPLALSRENLGRATFLIITGLIKKSLIADHIGVNFVDRVFDQPLLYTGFENLMAVYGYALQIYCDFSGYSDIAIGVALYLGYDLGINFDAPYKSLSITEFWRRWHISLSTWLRDFLYIPLGGNRKGPFRQNLNLFITMLLGGLWHGASLNFIFWGGLHGTALMVDKARMAILPKPGRLGGAIGWFLTFNFVCACWVFFRAANFTQAREVFTRIATAFHGEVWLQFLEGYPLVVGFMAIGYLIHAVPAPQYVGLRGLFSRLHPLLQAVFLAGVIVLVAQLQQTDIQPFIYFQF